MKTNVRCWSTSGSVRLSQNPAGPSGHARGSLRMKRNVARPRKTSGQWRAARSPRKCRIASAPMVTTKRPAQWWLYSDHARSTGLRSTWRPIRGSAARRSSSIGGLVSRGAAGAKRAATSATVARSVVTSTAGGSEVNEAAAKRIVIPSPSSISTKLKSRVPGACAARRTARMFSQASASAGTSSATLLSTITPYAVPTKAARSPTYASVSASPARTMAAMERKASVEKRFMVAGSASPARSEGGLFQVRRGPVTPARPAAIADGREADDHHGGLGERGARRRRGDRTQRQRGPRLRLDVGLGAQHEPQPRDPTERHAGEDEDQAAQEDVDEPGHPSGRQPELVAAGDDVPIGGEDLPLDPPHARRERRHRGDEALGRLVLGAGRRCRRHRAALVDEADMG